MSRVLESSIDRRIALSRASGASNAASDAAANGTANGTADAESMRHRMRRREAVLAELEDRRSLRHRIALRASRFERERDAVRRNLLLM
jgi:hypothetical protein